jgi:hypothetical protein
MNIREKLPAIALLLLAVFVVAGTTAGILFAIGTMAWVPFAVLSGTSLVASYLLGVE